MKRWTKTTRVVLGVVLGAGLVSMVGAVPATGNPAGTGLVISQVYGGGGNTGAPAATYTNDFIELFNPSSSPINVNGWSVQYAATGGNTWQRTNLTNFTIQPGQYYLVQQAAGAGGTTPLPTPDATGTIPMAAGAGKVALVSNQTTITTGTVCPVGSSSIVDFVGYGTSTTCSETQTTTPNLDNASSAHRLNQGCTDSDNNRADFTNSAAAPRNTASPLKSCLAVALSIDDVSLHEGQAGTTSFDFTVSLSQAAGPGGVTFDIATAPDSATAPADYTHKSLTGQTIPATQSTYTFSVLANGDPDVESDEQFFVNVTNVTGASVAKGQGIGTILNDDCGTPYTNVHDIQGSGLAAAITGPVTTEAIVVGDFEGPTTSGLQGVYLQDAPTDSDGDASTSDGIFVYTGSADNGLNVGDRVRVAGYAGERFDQTAITGSSDGLAPATSVYVCSTGNALPATSVVNMPFADADAPEPFEGMRVTFPQALVISEYFNYGRFGEMVLALPLPGESRHFTGTSIDPPGGPANARTLANSLRRVTLDDGLGGQNPEFLRHPNGLAFSLANLFRGGDTVQNASGVLGFDFDVYRIQPTSPAVYTSVNPRPAAPAPVGGSLRLAAMNTLNFFLTFGGTCGPAQNQDCRGADDAAEFQRQRDKLLQALAGLNSDVIGLNELENTTGVDPLSDPNGIVPGLNALLGPGTYAAITTGVIGGDAIRVGLIYKPATVTPVGPFQTLDSSDDARFLDNKNRPSLAQTFVDNSSGARFTVVVNHLKSKGSDCEDVFDFDAGDGQGECNGTREAAAQALVDWLATDPTGSGDPDFMILGDLNSYAREDPITAIKVGADDSAATSDDFRNLISDYQGPYAYSYVFDGQAGYLDHALANGTMATQVTGAADWHIDADEPSVVDYDMTFKGPNQEALYEANAYRASDHDPVVVGLSLDGSVPVTTITLDPTNPSGGAGWYVPWVKATVTATDTGVSFETRCILLPDSAPPPTFDSMSGCPYLTPGAYVVLEGKWTLWASTRDAAGNTDLVSKSFKIDKTPPTPALGALPASTTSTSFLVSWSATDPGPLSGVKNQDVRYRQKFGSTYGAYTTWKSAVATPGSATFTGARFNTYCFSTRARDNALNTSAWSVEKCIAIL